MVPRLQPVVPERLSVNADNTRGEVDNAPCTSTYRTVYVSEDASGVRNVPGFADRLRMIDAFLELP